MRTALFALALAGCAVDPDLADVAQHVTQARVLLPVDGTGQHAVVITGEYAPLDVALFEADGTPVAGAPIRFSAPEGSARFLDDGVTATDDEGLARMRPYPSSAAGAFTVWVHAADAEPVPFLLTNHAGVPAQLQLVSGTHQYAWFGQPFASPLAIVARDLYGNVVPDVEVDFVAPTDGATARMVDHGHTRTDATGTASTVAVAGAIRGEYYVYARVTGAPQQRFLLANTDPRIIRHDIASVQAHAAHQLVAAP